MIGLGAGTEMSKVGSDEIGRDILGRFTSDPISGSFVSLSLLIRGFIFKVFLVEMLFSFSVLQKGSKKD